MLVVILCDSWFGVRLEEDERLLLTLWPLESSSPSSCFRAAEAPQANSMQQRGAYEFPGLDLRKLEDSAFSLWECLLLEKPVALKRFQ